LATREIPAELERRIKALESVENQGEDFDGSSWAWLIGLGVVLPVIALVWGWAA
jgi:hypothetical protein